MDQELILPNALNREISDLHTPEELESRRIDRFNEDDKRDTKIVVAILAAGSLALAGAVYISAGQTADNEVVKAQQNAAIVRQYQISNQVIDGQQNDVMTLQVGTDDLGNTTFTPVR